MSAEVSAASLRPAWQSLRLWLALATLILLAGLGLALSEPSPGRSLDPASATKTGSRALSALLAARGTTSHAVTSVADAVAELRSATVLITYPDDFSAAQLRRVVDSGHRLVAIDPGPSALAVLAPGRSARHPANSTVAASVEPGCTWPGALAAGEVDFPADTAAYSGADACYGGRVITTPRLVILGTNELLTNGSIGHDHLAALAINALSDDGVVGAITWLLPGSDAAGAGAPSVWSLFPNWVVRAGWQLVLVGVLIALWRGRRLGPIVSEPLPVVVRAAEVVEGHGRLYLRAHARDRAAAALRAGAVTRLAGRLHLRSSATPDEVASLLDEPHARQLLGSSVPNDDRELIRLADDLHRLEDGPLTNGAPP
jgi:hypothetical protein